MFFFFFFNDTATTEIYTLSLHDALPISGPRPRRRAGDGRARRRARGAHGRRVAGPPGPGDRVRPRAARRRIRRRGDRKSTRLNSSHGYISYAVFCLKKKKTNELHAASTY